MNRAIEEPAILFTRETFFTYSLIFSLKVFMFPFFFPYFPLPESPSRFMFRPTGEHMLEIEWKARETIIKVVFRYQRTAALISNFILGIIFYILKQ